MLVPVAGGPAHQHSGSQAQESDEANDRETAAGLLHRLLGIDFLIFGSIRGCHRGAIDDQDAFATPEVARSDNPFSFNDHRIMDLL